MGNSWAGLVLDDYRAVLPLPFQSTAGVRWVVRPPFTQQCGPWGKFTDQDTERLLTAIPIQYVLVDWPLNERVARCSNKWFSLVPRTNLVVDTGQSYDHLRQGYSRSVTRYLKKYAPGQQQMLTTEETIRTYRLEAGRRAGLRDKHYAIVHRLIDAAVSNGAGRTVGYFSAEGQYLAGGFFPEHRGRMINLFAGSTEAGYRDRGMARLIDHLLAERAGAPGLFDFEGSDIISIQQFFRGFGATDRPYYRARRWPLR